MNRTIWINSTLPDACDIFSRNLRYLLHHVNPHKMPLAFACIGSANVCGDNLGPLIGTILTRHSLPNVYGTMAEPLNALTLPDYMPLLKAIEKSCCLVAVDAGVFEHLDDYDCRKLLPVFCRQITAALICSSSSSLTPALRGMGRSCHNYHTIL